VEVHAERVGCRVRGAVGREQEAQAVVEPGDPERDRDAEGADRLDVHAHPGHEAHDLGAHGVEQCLDHDQRHGDHQDGGVLRAVE
jgi:hypothetical protein